MCHTVNPLWTIILLQVSYRQKVTIVLLQAIISPESHYHTVTRYHIVTSHYHTVTRYHIVTSHYHTVTRYHIVTFTVTLCHVTSLLSLSRYCKLCARPCGAKEALRALVCPPESVIFLIIAYRVLLIVTHLKASSSSCRS